MNKNERLARQMMDRSRGDGFRSFEAENWEAMENLLVARGVPQAQARQMVMSARSSSPGFVDRGPQGAGQFTPGGTWGNPEAVAAQLTLNVRRVTANIAGPLPYVIFGAMDAQNGYRRALQGLLKGGTVLDSVEVGESDAQPEALVLTYSNGANTDTVEVTCGAAPYPLVLNSTITDTLQSMKMRLSISDPAASAQFLTDLSVQVRNMWGTVKSRSLNPESFRSPEQFQNGILDINVGINFDKETMIVGEILGTADFTVSHALFIQDFVAVRA